jgi:hypothetical protein
VEVVSETTGSGAAAALNDKVAISQLLKFRLL